MTTDEGDGRDEKADGRDGDGYPSPYEALQTAIAMSTTAATSTTTTATDAEFALPPEEDCKKCLKMKSTHVRGLPNLRLYTYSPHATRRGGPDDEAYRTHPWMRECVPRGFSIVVEKKKDAISIEEKLSDVKVADDPTSKGGEGIRGGVVAVARGPKKFGGVTDTDDDDGDRATLPLDQIEKWRSEGSLRIVREDKENGKFALVKLFRRGDEDGADVGERLAIVGSKNVHVIVKRDSPMPGPSKGRGRGGKRDERGNAEEELPLHWRIAKLVQNDWDKLEQLFDSMLSRQRDVTLIGEYCDGMHFVPLSADNPQPHIKYFGMFDETATPLDPLRSIADIASAGLDAVRCEELDPRTPIADCIKSARCGNGEGSVLYFRNVRTGRCVLAKNKTSLYILKRMAREKLMNGVGGFGALLEGLPKRVADASAYHYLNTDAAVRITSRLFDFGRWMMERKIPYRALGFMPVAGVRGQLEAVGFATLWERFLEEDSTTVEGGGDESVGPEDLWPFDAAEYRSRVQSTLISPKYERSAALDATPPLVVFFQLPQGGGKSTIGDTLKKRLEGRGIRTAIVEQDEWYGDSVAAQCYLEHLVRRTNTEVVLVTRCNANERHYNAYLSRAFRANARVAFFTPRQMMATAGGEDGDGDDDDGGGGDRALGLAVCLAGAIERSRVGDRLMIGRVELPKTEAAKIIVRTHGELRPHEQAVAYDILSTNMPSDDGERLVAQIPATDETKLLQFVEQHLEPLLALRRPVEDIVTDLCLEIYSIITQSSLPQLLSSASLALSSHRGLVSPALRDTLFVAFFPDRYGQLVLECVARKHGSKCVPRFHCTHAFLGGGRGGRGRRNKQKPPQAPNELPFRPCPPGATAALAVTHFVIRTSDGHAVFRATVPFPVDSDVPHITAYVPPGSKAVQSQSVIAAAAEAAGTAMDCNGTDSYSSDEYTVIRLETPVHVKAICEWH